MHEIRSIVPSDERLEPNGTPYPEIVRGDISSATLMENVIRTWQNGDGIIREYHQKLRVAEEASKPIPLPTFEQNPAANIEVS